jgi:hypothetical protein
MGVETLQPLPVPDHWAVSIPLDLSKWHWFPPSPRSSRSPPPEAAAHTASSIATESPFPLSPLGQLVNGMLRGLLGPFVHNSLDEGAETAAPTELGTFWDDLESSRPYLASASPADALRQLRRLRKRLDQDLRLGFVDFRTVVTRFGMIADLVGIRFPASSIGLEKYADFLSIILRNLPAAGIDEQDSLLSRFWAETLSRLEGFPVEWASFLTLQKIVDCIPQGQFPAVQGHVAVHIRRFLSHWTNELHAQPSNRAPALWSSRQLQLQIAAYALQKFDHVSRAAFDREIRTHLIDSGLTREVAGRVRQTWLSILAQLSTHEDDLEDLLFDGCVKLGNHERCPSLSGIEIGSLLIAHWGARGYLDRPKVVLRRYKSLILQHKDAAVAALLPCLRNQASAKACMASLLRFLRRTNRMDELLHGIGTLASPALGLVPWSLLRMVAGVGRDHHFALRMHAIAVRHFQGPKDEASPMIWAKYLEQILLDRRLGIRAVWELLSLDPRQNKSRKGRAPSLRLHHSHARLVERLASLLPQATHMSDRAIERHVVHCIELLLSRKEGLEPAVLQAFYVVIKRQVKNMPSAQFHWWLRILEKQYGPRTADLCATEWQHWQRSIRHIDRIQQLGPPGISGPRI